ncbi:MAG TPA: zinc ribbon domain-containing protein [Candidatus Dormibacteraeota bacterium]|nr:zinc ribbon domain-containing protein [Candidatus Dormibacteraeota bacterium]
MDASTQVDKSEWKAFLEDLSEFEKKYKLLLNRLDTAEGKLRGSGTPEEKVDQGNEASPQASGESTEKEKEVTGEVEGGFLSRLETRLKRASGPRSTPPGNLGYATCSRCGFQIVRATRFCQRCGADFGKVVCSCGRGLGSGDRFCDRCGRGVEVGGGGA